MITFFATSVVVVSDFGKTETRREQKGSILRYIVQDQNIGPL